MSDNSSKLAQLPVVVKKAIENYLKDTHTAMPGIIESFDAQTQLATVQPAVRRIFKTVDEDIEMIVPKDLPKLINVPVMYPKGGGFSLTFPVEKGDECLLVFCERDISQWYEKGGVQDPNTKRFHDLSDAVAYVGISSKVKPIENFRSDRMEMRNSTGGSAIAVMNDGSCSMTTGDGQNGMIVFPSGTVGFLNGDGVVFLGLTGGGINIEAAGNVTITAETVNINADNVNLGSGGKPIARLGDTVQVNTGTGTGTITTAGVNTSI